MRGLLAGVTRFDMMPGISMKRGQRVWLMAALILFAEQRLNEAAEKSDVIRLENQKAGTTDWLLTKIKKGTRPPKFEPADEPYEKGWRRRKELEGFCSHTSIRAGETLKIFVSTDPTIKYRIDIYRMGYYGGKGARLVRSAGAVAGGGAADAGGW